MGAIQVQGEWASTKSEAEANRQKQEPEPLGKLGDQSCDTWVHAQVTCM